MTNMSTLYVAGPMTGKPQFNYPHFVEVAETLTECGYRVLNPAEVDNMHRAERRMEDLSLRHECADCDAGRKHEWHWYMRRTIKMLLEADAIALLRGWEQSKGAKIEVALAQHLQMPFRPWQSWVLDVRGDDPTKPGTRRKKEEA